MIEEIITIYFVLLELFIAGIVGFTIFMIIQLISYRIFKFNLYKWLDKKLFR